MSAHTEDYQREEAVECRDLFANLNYHERRN